MVQTYAQAQQLKLAREAKVLQDRQRRRDELDYFQTLELERMERRQAQRAQADEFAAQVQTNRARAAAGEVMQRPDSLNDHYLRQREVEKEERERLRVERINNMTQRDLWFASLPYDERRRVQAWQEINGQLFPFEGV